MQAGGLAPVPRVADVITIPGGVTTFTVIVPDVAVSGLDARTYVKALEAMIRAVARIPNFAVFFMP